MTNYKKNYLDTYINELNCVNTFFTFHTSHIIYLKFESTRNKKQEKKKFTIVNKYNNSAFSLSLSFHRCKKLVVVAQ